MKKATAYANANIALVKYWGKADGGHNIPAVSSLSMTLHDMGCEVSLSPRSHAHDVMLNDMPVSEHARARTSVYLEQVRLRYPYAGYFQVASQSKMPFASGLASSAAYFAALATALNHALAIDGSPTERSILARMGSGSAARSIFGGFAALHGGAIAHEAAYAYPLSLHASFDLHLVVAVVDDQPKARSSRDAMIKTKASSPFFEAFVASHAQDFNEAICALREGHFANLGVVMEHSTLKMFATMWTAQPAIMYWQPQSLALIAMVQKLRNEYGPIAYFTMDAGPNVKILCEGKNLALVLRTMARTGLTKNIFCATPGAGAHVCINP